MPFFSIGTEMCQNSHNEFHELHEFSKFLIINGHLIRIIREIRCC
jgi:hypothetical protein